MKLLDEYFEAQKKVYDHFGYVEDWKVIPLDDQTDVFWYEDSSQVHFSDSKENLKSIIANDFDYDALGCDGNDYYTYEIFHYVHLPKHVYRAEDMTMIVVDSETDGNKFLSVFDNAKEVTL